MNRAALELALADVVAHHACLRTTYALGADGVPVQRVGLPYAVPIEVTAVRDPNDVKTHLQAEIRRPFDLERGPILRASAFALSPEDHVVFVNVHHIATDGWSDATIMEDVATSYVARRRGVAPHLPSSPLEFADFAIWQAEELAAGGLDDAINPLVARLRGASAPGLQPDRPRGVRQSFDGESFSAHLLDASEADRLRAVVAEHGATVLTGLVSLFMATIARFSGTPDVVVGTNFTGRPEPELDRVVGFFANTIALRCDIRPEDTFATLLERAHEVVVEGHECQDAPFPEVVKHLEVSPSRSRHPVFDVLFVLQPEPLPVLDLEGLDCSFFDYDPGTSIFELSVDVFAADDGALRTVWDFQTALFDRGSVDAIHRDYASLVRACIDDPEALLRGHQAVRGEERRRVISAWQGRPSSPSETTVLRAIVDRCAGTPKAIAVQRGRDRWTYEELVKVVRARASALRDLGVAPGVRVGLLVPRSFDSIATLLAVMWAGGVAVLMDTAHPSDRLATIAEDAEIAFALTVASVDLPQRIRRVDLESLPIGSDAFGPIPTPTDTAYVVYTSGSSGTPKGCATSHGALINHALGVAERFELDETDRVRHAKPLGFDASLEEFIPALVRGSTIVVEPEAVATSDLAGALDRDGVTVACLTASEVSRWIEELTSRGASPPSSLRLLSPGSEALPCHLYGRWLRAFGPGTRWVAAYGPSETTITAAMLTFEKRHATDPRCIIGTPFPGARVYVLDAAGDPVPVGAIGELVIGGAGVGQGYLDDAQPGFTADPFAQDPGARMYRTGDLGRWLPSGELEFLGRRDAQVKIHGVRVELAEIEHALVGHPSVVEAACSVHRRAGADTLAAFCVARDALDPDALRAWMRRRLPSTFVPSIVEQLEALPRTTSGKLDRSALVPTPPTAMGTTAPVDALERALCTATAEVLNLDSVGTDANFFDLGGHSLAAVQVLALLRHRTDQRASVADIIECPVLRELAARIRARASATPEIQ